MERVNAPEPVVELEEAIARGLSWLHEHQLPSGEFRSCRGRDAAMQQPYEPDGCVFPTALLAANLLFIAEHPEADAMLTRATAFFLNQAAPGGLWHHFTHGHILRLLCASDADDTACVSAVLRARGLTAPLAGNVSLLLANRDRRGLFYTWFVVRFRWVRSLAWWRITLPEWRHPRRNVRFWRTVEGGRQAVDGVVNANVLWYLGERPETQPVIAYLLRIIAERRETECDLWYHDAHLVYYFLSRNYDRGITSLEPARQPVIDRILAAAKADGRLGETVLDTALAVCTLLNWRVESPELASAVQFLRRAQLPGGEWPRWMVYYGGPSEEIGWGSEEMITGFCLEALARYRALGRQSAGPPPETSRAD